MQGTNERVGSAREARQPLRAGQRTTAIQGSDATQHLVGVDIPPSKVDCSVRSDPRTGPIKNSCKSSLLVGSDSEIRQACGTWDWNRRWVSWRLLGSEALG